MVVGLGEHEATVRQNRDSSGLAELRRGRRPAVPVPTMYARACDRDDRARRADTAGEGRRCGCQRDDREGDRKERPSQPGRQRIFRVEYTSWLASKRPVTGPRPSSSSARRRGTTWTLTYSNDRISRPVLVSKVANRRRPSGCAWRAGAGRDKETNLLSARIVGYHSRRLKSA